MSLPRPPAAARWLLSRRTAGPLGEAIQGDLEERFRSDVARRGIWAARLRYWKDVLSPSLSEATRRAHPRSPLGHGRPGGSRRLSGALSAAARDLGYAVRILRKSPGFTAVAVLSLALGIGPNTAIFSVVDAVLLQDRGASEPDRLVDVYNRSPDGRWFYTGFVNVERLREGADDVFESVAAWVLRQAAVDEDGVPRPVAYEMVTGNYFSVLGLRPERGRFFTAEEDATPGTHPVAVVSHPFWTSRMGADPAAVGSTLRVNGRPYTVVGVAPEGFTGKALPGVQADLWLPYAMYPHLDPGEPEKGNLGITARVRPGVPVATAVAAVDALSARIDADRKAAGASDDFVLRAFPWSDLYLHPDLDRPVLLIATLLQVVVGLVLLVACVNLAGFFLARATRRRREVAVRLSLGAGRGAVARQLLTEALLLGLLGGAAGLVLGIWTARALAGIDVPLSVPLQLRIALDRRVLAFTAGVSLLAGLVFGMAPALQASREPVASVLRDEGGAVAGARGRARLRALLVGGQMALSVVLLVGAGLFVRSLLAATAMDPGFDTGDAAVVEVAAGASGYDSPEALDRLLTEALPNIARDASVRSAALVTRMPLSLGTWVKFYDVPGVPPPDGRDEHRIEYASVSPGYFATMDVDLLEGRGFSEADLVDAPRVAVVSQALARRFWPGESALGRTLLPVGDEDGPVTVVGVAEDVKIWSLTEAPLPYLYLPFEQAPSTYFYVVARGSGPAGALATRVRDAFLAADPALFLPQVGTMDEHLGYILFLPRMGALLIGGFALLALVLASVGLYGVVGHDAASRTREIGIRMTLGAARGSVVGLVMRAGLILAAVGGAVGVLGAVAAAGMVERYLIGVSRWDPVTLVGVPLLLVCVAGLATFLPARRASRVDPSEALRAE